MRLFPCAGSQFFCLQCVQIHEFIPRNHEPCVSCVSADFKLRGGGAGAGRRVLV